MTFSRNMEQKGSAFAALSMAIFSAHQHCFLNHNKFDPLIPQRNEIS